MTGKRPDEKLEELLKFNSHTESVCRPAYNERVLEVKRVAHQMVVIFHAWKGQELARGLRIVKLESILVDNYFQKWVLIDVLTIPMPEVLTSRKA